MRLFSYRNKSRLKTGLFVLMAATLLTFFLLIGVFLYLQRYLVYTADGVHFDFSRRPEVSQDTNSDTITEDFVLEQQELPVIDRVLEEEELAAPHTGRLQGYYLTTGMLADIPSVRQALAQDDSIPQAVMLDMKSIFGNFYYPTSIPTATVASVDTEAIVELITELDKKDVYLIARIPAFVDSNYALENQSSGLALKNGALWMDENGCYWLNPADSLVTYYLPAIASELRALGFDEILFDQFCFPDSNNIVYPSDFSKEEALLDCARELIRWSSENGPAISLGTDDPVLAALAKRVYFTEEMGSNVSSLAEALAPSLEDPTTQLVFVTGSRDTRFRDYSILQPLIDND